MQALDTSSTLGDLTVVRSTYEASAGTWTNAHTWTITFVHQTVDFADLTVDGTNLAGAAAEAVTVGTASSPITNVEADAANVRHGHAGPRVECGCRCAGSAARAHLVVCPGAATHVRCRSK